MSKPIDLSERIEELLKDYNGYDFCGEKACSGQGKAIELEQRLEALCKEYAMEIVGEDELMGRPEVVGSPVASKLWTRDTLRQEQRKAIQEDTK